MSDCNESKRRQEEHARLVRETAQIVGSNKNPDAFDGAFRILSLKRANADRRKKSA